MFIKIIFMNDIMSFGTHRYGNKFVNSIEIKPEHIDMSSGTGDISNLILKKNSLQSLKLNIITC